MGKLIKQFLWPSNGCFIGILIFLLGLLFLIWSYYFSWPQKIDGLGILLEGGELGEIISPYEGIVEIWHKEEGDTVENSDLLLSIRLNKEPFNIRQIYADKSYEIAEILSFPGTLVQKGGSIAITTKSVEQSLSELKLIGFVSSLDGKKIKPKMSAQIMPSIFSVYKEGFLEGAVLKVGKLPMSKSAISSLIKVPELAKYIREKIDAQPFLITLSLIKDPNHQSGYLWSGPGTKSGIEPGVLANFVVIYDRPRLIYLLWPALFSFFGS